MARRDDEGFDSSFLVLWLLLLGVAAGLKLAELRQEREALESRVHRLEYGAVVVKPVTVEDAEAWLASQGVTQPEGPTS